MAKEKQKIPPGYKQTEIGVIPKDWEVKNIESFTPQGKKYGIVDGPFGSNLKTEHYRKSGIPIITSGYVTDGKFFADEYLYVDKEKFKQEKRSAVRGGDIIMAKIGARCGASAILPKNHPEGILSGNALKITIDENKFSTFFVWQILWNLYVKGDLELLKTTGAQPALSMANLKKFQIAVPETKTEQDIIADVLLDFNALVSKLESLIDKKKLIKQGAMQELLTGKRRLPGFGGKWQIKKLGEVADFERGQGLSKSDLKDNGIYKCIHYGQLFTGYKELIKEIFSKTDVADNHFYSKTNDVLMPTSDVTPRGLATASCIKENGIMLGGGIMVIRLHPEYDGVFLSYFITQNKNAVLKFVKGSTVFHLYASDITNFEIKFPELKEQTAIANILSDMDAEIEKLESQLAKYQSIKQGMMQTLLTGRIRLV